MNKAQKQLDSLPYFLRERIYKKLKWYLRHEDPLVFADKLTDFSLGEYRYRIGDYRVIFDVTEDLMRINRIGHRREIYR